MMAKTRPILPPLFGLALLLAACGTMPRGAGLQSEVLQESQAAGRSAVKDALPSDFAVEAITRDKLNLYDGWPARAQGRGYSWPKGQGRAAVTIAPGDTLTVSVWVSEDNSLITGPGQRVAALPPAVVSPSGQIFLPYAGQIDVGGRSQEKARSLIEEAYAAVTPSAQVQLVAQSGRQSSASVVSGVANPGAFPLIDSGTTVLDMLAQAGGVPDAVKNPQLRLQRGDTTFGTALKSVFQDTEMNIPVQGGDRIFVEKDARYFLALGAAGSKAQHYFPQDRVSALDALSIIGGLQDARANAQGILILRSYAPGDVRADGSGPRHTRTIFTIDLTSADGLFSAGEFRIQPGDLVYVTESPLLGARNVLALIGSVFGLANTAQGL